MPGAVRLRHALATAAGLTAAAVEFDKSKELLEEAATRAPDRHAPADRQRTHINGAGPAKQLLKSGGSRWTCRRWTGGQVTPAAKKDASDKGGWNNFIIRRRRLFDPLTNTASATGDKARFGWPLDEEIEKLRTDFARESDPKKQGDRREGPGPCTRCPATPLGQFCTPRAIPQGGQRHRPPSRCSGTSRRPTRTYSEQVEARALGRPPPSTTGPLGVDG